MARIEYYKTLLISDSGKGKTYSFRNMNKETTGFINLEKSLSFKNEFKHYANPQTITETKVILAEYVTNKDIDCIVLDSLSKYLDKLLGEARKSRKGFDVWGYYNEEVGKFLDYINSIDKYMFITGHPEYLVDAEGVGGKRLKTKGKEWEGNIEKEFTIVGYVDRKLANKKVEAWFDFYLNESSSKIPPAILGEDVTSIPNDANYLLEQLIKFNS